MVTAAPTEANEAPFSFSELFFSRTDLRGVISAGNDVFQRISQYSWDELINKPHNIIRHVDMPRGVFHLMWQTIKAKQPIGAYVKNRTKDGKYYWVFAVVTPIEDGYLSVRLKPSSALFAAIVDAYQTLRAAERAESLTPEQSSARLLKMLQGLGFPDYSTFMSVAVREEVAAREEALQAQAQPFLDIFERISKRAQMLTSETSTVFDTYQLFAHVPLNLRVKSAQLGPVGKSIGVISENFNIVASSIRDEIDNFKLSTEEVFHSLHSGQFLLCTAKLQAEVAAYFRNEIAASNNSNTHELELLERQMVEYQHRANESLAKIEAKIRHFQNDFLQLKKSTTGLEVIRVMGKVDAARLPRDTGLTELIDDLGSFQSALSTSLAAIERHNTELRLDTHSVLHSLTTAA